MDLHIEDGGVAPLIRTPRLTLRPFVETDAQPIADALTDPRVSDWLTMVPQPYTLDDAVRFIRDFTQDPALPHWAIDAGDGVIGTISCKPDLGYWLHPDLHGRGYMTEAAMAAVTWHFDADGGDLVSGYHVGNKASCAVLTKLGFRDTHIESQTTVNGKTVALQRMVLTAPDWQVCRG